MLFALAGNLLWNKPCCRRRCKSTQHGKIQNQKLTLFMQLSHWDLHQNTPIKAKGSPKGESLQGYEYHAYFVQLHQNNWYCDVNLNPHSP